MYKQKKHANYIILLIFLLIQLFPVFAQSQENTQKEKTLRAITVTDKFQYETQVPGSTSYIDKEELIEYAGGSDDVGRILRQIPGVNIQEEDGFGLRPNIGFRGVPNERSSRITLMEDSILTAPAPYAAPSAYYFPPIGRMNGIEVLKGNAQLKYGPYTTGGSLNMLSTPLPKKDYKVKARTQIGEFGTNIFHFNAGATEKHFSGMVETYQAGSDGFKDLQGGGDTGYDIEDYLGKFRINTDREKTIYQELEFKIGTYKQDSNETYLGLTQSDFNNDPYARYAGSQLDNINVDHDQFVVSHYIEPTNNTSIKTSYYYNSTDRNWFKLEKVNGNSTASILDMPGEFVDELTWIRGGDSPEDAFAIRNNRRSYFARGIQSTLNHESNYEGIENNFEFGVRYHEDEEDRFQEEYNYQMLDGVLVQTSRNEPGSNANRIGSARAISFHMQDILKISNFSIVPSLRYESINFKREDFGKEDPTRTGNDLSVSKNSVDKFIPGIGVKYEALESFQPFFGVHKGFSPPGPTSSSEVREEESINYEAGFDWLYSDFDGRFLFFLNDYKNLLGADTVSSGGEGTGDLFNGGEATTYGIESQLRTDIADWFGGLAFELPFDVNYTFTSAEFDSSFDSDFFGNVVNGDSIPYIPENQLNARLAIKYDKFLAALKFNYVDSMPTVAGGVSGEGALPTDSYSVFDLDMSYKVREDTKLFFGLKNLFDEEYVVARRPSGARPGLPQLFFAGFEIELG